MKCLTRSNSRLGLSWLSWAVGDFPADLTENSVQHGASVDSVRASSSPDIFNIKYILVTECQLLSSGNLIQEGFIKNQAEFKCRM